MELCAKISDNNGGSWGKLMRNITGDCADCNRSCGTAAAWALADARRSGTTSESRPSSSSTRAQTSAPDGSSGVRDQPGRFDVEQAVLRIHGLGDL